MPRAVSAVLFAVLWTGAMSWARGSDVLGLAVLVAAGALAGLASYWLSRPACGSREPDLHRPGWPSLPPAAFNRDGCCGSCPGSPAARP